MRVWDFLWLLILGIGVGSLFGAVAGMAFAEGAPANVQSVAASVLGSFAATLLIVGATMWTVLEPRRKEIERKAKIGSKYIQKIKELLDITIFPPLDADALEGDIYEIVCDMEYGISDILREKNYLFEYIYDIPGHYDLYDNLERECIALGHLIKHLKRGRLSLQDDRHRRQIRDQANFVEGARDKLDTNLRSHFE